MYKDIVVPITGTQGDRSAVNVALDIAAAHEARLTVLEAVTLPMPVTGPFGLTADLGAIDVYRELKEQAQRNVNAWKSVLADEQVPHEVRLVEGLITEPAQLAAHHAHYADLAVLAALAGDSSEGDRVRDYFASLLVQSGRPVLAVPLHCKVDMPPRRVVIAWRPSGESARAIHDALPLLKQAERVDVLVVDATKGERGNGDNPGVDIAEHLRRHGVTAMVEVRTSDQSRVAAVLLQHARDIGAGMLVVGGYGHSRIREWALGGVTRELLFNATIPVFFSH